VLGIDQAAEGRKAITDIGNIEVAPLLDPCGEQVVVGDEVPNVAFDVIDGLSVFL
jgi:hypothetical protein